MTSSPVALAVPFADTRAAELRLSHAATTLPALAERVVRRGGYEVALRVLGQSHQVLVRAGGRVVHAETLACDLGPDDAGRAPEPGPGFAYSVRRVEPAQFGAEVGRALAELDDFARAPGDGAEPDGLLAAAFPGTAHAVTALALGAPTAAGGARWRTLHAYPQSGELVETTTELTGTIPEARTP